MTKRFGLGGRLFICLLVVALLPLVGAVGCKKEAKFHELKVAFSDDISNLDPATLSIALDRAVAENLYNGLTRFDLTTFEVVPALAKSWDLSPDGKIYTFHLREGVMFHKGYGEMTSEDVAFSIMRHKDPAVKSREAGTFAIVDKVETPDKYTAEVHLTTTVPAFPALLAWQSGFIVSKRAVTELGEDYPLAPIGTGPFYFDTWVQKEKIVLKAHEEYWRGRPKVDQVTVRLIADETIAVDAVARGEIDMVALYQAAAYKAAMENPNVKMFVGKSGYNNYLYLQQDFFPTNDLRIRQAIAHTLDLAAIQDAIGGFLIKNDSVMNPLCIGWTEAPLEGKYPHDLDKARELVRQANLPAGTKLVIYYRKAHLYENIALMVKEQLSQVFTVELVQLEAGIQATRFKEGQFNIGVWATTRLESDLYMSQHFYSKGGGNYSKYNNPAVDKLVEEARAELDPTKRAQLYVQLQEILSNDLPVIPTGLMGSVIVASKNVKDVWTHPYPGIIPLDTVVMED